MLSMLPVPSPANVTARMLNALLRREPWAAERLSRHSGKSLRFTIGGWRVGYTIEASGMLQASHGAVVPDVTLSLPAERLADLPAILRSRELDAITQMLHVQGDAGLATVVSELARDLRWDVEDDVSGLFGDLLGPKLVQGGRAATGLVQSTAQRAAANAAEYLGEEGRMLATKPALEHFRTDLAGMLRRLDLLERRMCASHVGRGA